MSPLLKHSGFEATSKNAKKFIEDPNHPVPKNSYPLAKLISQKLRPHYWDPPAAKVLIAHENLQREFKNWTERTHTSLEGTRLGHYKVWLRDYRTLEQRQSDEDSGKQMYHTPNKFFQMQTQKVNLAIKLGHPLWRWRKVQMILISKDQDKIPSILRLRAIDSFDAEINWLRRVLVLHRIIQITERQGIITEHHWGGRRNK